jgi:hypothetical protein
MARVFSFLDLAQHLLPPSLLNFSAGILAGAGINMLTSVATGPTTVSTSAIIGDSVVWVIAAIFVAAAASIAESAERKADLVITERLSPAEKEAVHRNEAVQVAMKFWILVALGVTFVVLAASLIPKIGF